MSRQTGGVTELEALAERLKAVADPVRLRVLRFLRAPEPRCCRFPSEVCACDLEAVLGLSQPTVSHHMAILVRAGVVEAKKRGRWVVYSLNRGAIRRLSASIAVLAGETEDAKPGEGGEP